MRQEDIENLSCTMSVALKSLTNIVANRRNELEDLHKEDSIEDCVLNNVERLIQNFNRVDNGLKVIVHEVVYNPDVQTSKCENKDFETIISFNKREFQTLVKGVAGAMGNLLKQHSNTDTNNEQRYDAIVKQFTDKFFNAEGQKVDERVCIKCKYCDKNNTYHIPDRIKCVHPSTVPSDCWKYWCHTCPLFEKSTD